MASVAGIAKQHGKSVLALAGCVSESAEKKMAATAEQVFRLINRMRSL